MNTNRVKKSSRASRAVPTKAGIPIAKRIIVAPEANDKQASVTGIFKKPIIPPTRITKTVSKKQANEHQPFTAPVTPALPKPHIGSSPSSSPNPQDESLTKKSDLHPLATAFKESTIAYRTHLYNTTTAKLNATLSELLTRLSASNINTSSPSPGTSQADARTAQISPTCCDAPALSTKNGATRCSTCGHTFKDAPLLASASASIRTDATIPRKRTLAEEYDHIAAKAFRPIGTYSIERAIIHRNGSQTSTRALLAQELATLEARRKNIMAEFRALEAQWEGVVGEIYKLGTACLGADAMKALGLVVEPESAPEAKASRVLSPVVVAESEKEDVAAVEKRAVLQEKRHEYPAFLKDLSVLANGPIALVPGVPRERVKELEKRVGELGGKQVEELKGIEDEYARWWNKKCEQIMQTLQAD